MNSTEYLARIGLFPDHLEPNEEVLRLLQRSHLLAVPFENLDIHWKRPIVLDTDRFYEKVVVSQRGGFCYELNGLFNELLKSIGFQTRLVSARVFHDDGSIGPEFDHAAIIVTTAEGEFLTDVGFGDFTTEPLRFSLGTEQHDPAGVFVIRGFDDGYFEVAKRDGQEWRGQYVFNDAARDLAEFTEMCDFQQYSPDSHFTKGKVCSILTEDGRKTLSDKSFIVTTRSVRSETAIGKETEFDETLVREFGISRTRT